MRTDLINDLRAVSERIYRGETDGWDYDVVREAVAALVVLTETTED